MKFKVRACIEKGFNPFLPCFDAFARQFRTWIIEAKDEEEVRLLWDQAKADRIDGTVGYVLHSIELSLDVSHGRKENKDANG